MQNEDGPHLKRIHKPLMPIVGVTVVSGDDVRRISPSNLTISKVGHKAYGLASLPKVWSRSFFVVEGGSYPTQSALEKCLKKFKFGSSGEVMVRSSGTEESILARGSNDSTSCLSDSLKQTITDLESRISLKADEAKDVMHWVVQEKIHVSAKGHLSNERRLSKVDRDWLAEIEQTSSQPYESHPIAIRTWRDARIPDPNVLLCPYKANYVDCLEKVARWAFARQIRVHFEWVWDGRAVYIVQADESTEDTTGTDPHDVVVVPEYVSENEELLVFHRATEEDFLSLPKLGNTKIYKNIGYEITDFYILSDEIALRKIVDEEIVSSDLRKDLEELTKAPLIIRTDGLNIPSDQRTMLPRSDELRSAAAAQDWLINKFASEIRKLKLADKALSLVAHNFIPAASSAWCQAHPDKRRVRIESLWGIPEGLYWYAHDTFDVDTLYQSVSGKRPDRSFDVHRRVRFKSQFIAPDEEGHWILHKTKPGPDWNTSIRKTQWLEEMAWSSRRIAKEAGYPVVVMWFVDVPKKAHQHEILPWYHEEWHGAGSVVKAAPRKKHHSIKTIGYQPGKIGIDCGVYVTRGGDMFRESALFH